MEEEVKREFKGIWIPKEIWLHPDLSLIEKIVLAEINNFEKANGCFASNAFLGKLLGVGASRISQIVSKLSRLNLVKVELEYFPHSKQVKMRIIKVNKREIYK